MFLLAALVMLADALTKLLAVKLLDGAGTVRVLDGLLEFRLFANDGMALGLFSGNDIAIIVLPLCVMTAGFFLIRRYVMTPFKGAAISLVLGGFLGNFIERLLRGFVLDMIYFPFMPWFVCNVADIAICAGVLLLAVSLLFRPSDWREKSAKDKPNSVD